MSFFDNGDYFESDAEDAMTERCPRVRLKLIKPLLYPIRFVCDARVSTPTISGCFASLLGGAA